MLVNVDVVMIHLNACDIHTTYNPTRLRVQSTAFMLQTDFLQHCADGHPHSPINDEKLAFNTHGESTQSEPVRENNKGGARKCDI